MSNAFARRFDHGAHWLARAPGRVNLIGEHTDYNGGLVLPLAIDRETRVYAAPNGSRRAVLYSCTFDQQIEIELDSPAQPAPRGSWDNYPRGVLAGFRATGAQIPGFDAVIESTVPVGSGLSSSASLEAALATVIEGLSGHRLDPRQKMDLCRHAEHEFAGVPCGMMDQAISIAGRSGCLLLLDCATGSTEWVPFDDPSIGVLVIDTHVRHALASSEYARRRGECEAAAAALGVALLCSASLAQLDSTPGLPPLLARRARHVLSEQARTRAAVTAIRGRDWIALGAAMYASHASLRDEFEVSCEELDAVVDVARVIGSDGGVYGCRMTGGGFGGCAVAVIEAARAADVAARIAEGVRKRAAFEPRIFLTRAADGATLQALPH